jgi:hypothetical protein
MYRFSRQIYRELAPRVTDDCFADATTNRKQLLEACERAMQRLAYDRRYFARPARSLFNEVRVLFPLSEQVRAYLVIEQNVNLALEHLARIPYEGFRMDGRQLQCRAVTRQGKPCQRQPLPHNEYCPSHQHLAETEDMERVAHLRPVGTAA